MAANVDLPDMGIQHGIGPGACTGRTTSPLTISRAGDLKHPAQPGHAVAVALRVNPGIYGLLLFASDAFPLIRGKFARIYSACLCGLPLAIMQIACFGLTTSAAFSGHYACRIVEAGSNPSHQ
jgi:hypothetical protein